MTLTNPVAHYVGGSSPASIHAQGPLPASLRIDNCPFACVWSAGVSFQTTGVLNIILSTNTALLFLSQ